jgi:hypothetical protein
LTLQTQVDALNEKATQMQKAITETQAQTRQVHFFPEISSNDNCFVATDDDWHRLDDEGDGSCQNVFATIASIGAFEQFRCGRKFCYELITSAI